MKAHFLTSIHEIRRINILFAAAVFALAALYMYLAFSIAVSAAYEDRAGRELKAAADALARIESTYLAQSQRINMGLAVSLGLFDKSDTIQYVYKTNTVTAGLLRHGI